jgi:amino-acid N-acetyltransferase
VGLLIEEAHPADFDAVPALLAQARLPEAGVREVDVLLVARLDRQLVGSAALEFYADAALLRSVAVDASSRGRGIGRCLTDAALRVARVRGVRAVYLLTETAPDFFARFGFEVVDRTSVPAAVQASPEFAWVCPAGAQAMALRLG